MAARQARSVMPQREPQREQEALPALPRTSAVLPQDRAAPHVPSGPARANSEADLGTARSPEVFAAAQARLQSQLQQLAVKPELLNLFQVLCANSQTSRQLLQAPARTPGPERDFETLFQHGKSQTCRQIPVRPVSEGLDIGKLVSESRMQAAGTAKLGRTDSGRGTVENSLRREGGAAAELHSVKSVNTGADSEKLHSLPAWQQDSQAEAAMYAQHLYSLLAQAQVGLIVGAFFERALNGCCKAVAVDDVEHDTACHGRHSIPPIVIGLSLSWGMSLHIGYVSAVLVFLVGARCQDSSPFAAGADLVACFAGRKWKHWCAAMTQCGGARASLVYLSSNKKH